MLIYFKVDDSENTILILLHKYQNMLQRTLTFFDTLSD